MFRDDKKEMSPDEMQQLQKEAKKIQEAADAASQKAREAAKEARAMSQQCGAQLEAMMKQNEQTKTSSQGIFSHDQPKANEQLQDEPKNKKGKGGCNIL